MCAQTSTGHSQSIRAKLQLQPRDQASHAGNFAVARNAPKMAIRMLMMQSTERGKCVGWMILIAAALLAGCMVGPDYKRPDVKPLPEFISPTTRASTTQPVEITWWRTLHDPHLNELVYQASRDSLDVAAAAARVRQ